MEAVQSTLATGMSLKEQAELFVLDPSGNRLVRDGQTFLKYPFIVRPAGGHCGHCGKLIQDYATKMVHVESSEIRCLEHFGKDAYWGARTVSDPSGFLTYCDF